MILVLNDSNLSILLSVGIDVGCFLECILVPIDHFSIWLYRVGIHHQQRRRRVLNLCSISLINFPFPLQQKLCSLINFSVRYFPFPLQLDLDLLHGISPLTFGLFLLHIGLGLVLFFFNWVAASRLSLGIFISCLLFSFLFLHQSIISQQLLSLFNNLGVRSRVALCKPSKDIDFYRAIWWIAVTILLSFDMAVSVWILVDLSIR